jgi:hypothetical protein
MNRSISPMKEEIPEYKVHSGCHACVTCGGTVTMRMHPSYLEQVATDCCSQQKSIRYYADINLILEDTDCCGKKSFLIHEVTNLPFRAGTFFAPIESANQKQLEAFLTDLKARTAAAKFKRPMGEVMERE